jgi:hypothetical protein
MIAKYGDPLDESDPRNWMPSKRAESGMSLEDQVKYLNLDVERNSLGFAKMLGMFMQMHNELNKLQDWAAEQVANNLMDLMKTDPARAAKELSKYLGVESPKGSYGPLEDDPNANVKYAGSAKGIRPDQMVETPQGWILGKDIPGYRDDPEWMPSPDWMEANCMCPLHKAQRVATENTRPDDGFDGTGFYL